MKVLLLAEALDPKSGWGRYASSVITEYKKRSIECSVLAVNTRNESTIEARALLPLTPLGLLRNALATRRVARDCDIVHAFDCWPLAVYGWLAVLGTKKKLFITGVGTYSVAPFSYPWKRFLLTRACTRAEKIFAIGSYTKKRMLEKITLSNIVTVFWGCSPLPTLTPAEFSALATAFSFPLDRHPVILTVGMIKKRKGQLDTLRALALLRKHYPTLLYVVVGSTDDTDYVNEMRTFAKENGMEDTLRIVDTANSDKALSFFYKASDIFAMNSNNDGEHFEGFGLVFLEAEQFGKPVVGSRDCGIEEALEDGKNGYLTNQGDAADIADKIGKILDGRMEAFGRHSIAFSAQFTWGKTAEQHLRYYAGEQV